MAQTHEQAPFLMDLYVGCKTQKTIAAETGCSLLPKPLAVMCARLPVSGSQRSVTYLSQSTPGVQTLLALGKRSLFCLSVM